MNQRTDVIRQPNVFQIQQVVDKFNLVAKSDCFYFKGKCSPFPVCIALLKFPYSSESR